MAAIGRFQKGEDFFYAKVVDGELFRLPGDVFGSPSFDRQPTPRQGSHTFIPVIPPKVIHLGLHYADIANHKQLTVRHAELVGCISTNLPLLPGDVILTGTPSGIGAIQSGDKLEVRIQGLAPLGNSVK